MSAPRPFLDTEDPRIRFAAAESGFAFAAAPVSSGSPIVNPWLGAEIGVEFCVPQAIAGATRNADYYRRKYGLAFTCRQSDSGIGSIVRRIR